MRPPHCEQCEERTHQRGHHRLWFGRAELIVRKLIPAHAPLIANAHANVHTSRGRRRGDQAPQLRGGHPRRVSAQRAPNGHRGVAVIRTKLRPVYRYRLAATDVKVPRHHRPDHRRIVREGIRKHGSLRPILHSHGIPLAYTGSGQTLHFGGRNPLGFRALCHTDERSKIGLLCWSKISNNSNLELANCASNRVLHV